MRMFQLEHIAKTLGCALPGCGLIETARLVFHAERRNQSQALGCTAYNTRSRPASNRHKRSACTTVKSLVNTDSNRLDPVDLPLRLMFRLEHCLAMFLAVAAVAKDGERTS